MLVSPRIASPSLGDLSATLPSHHRHPLLFPSSPLIALDSSVDLPTPPSPSMNPQHKHHHSTVQRHRRVIAQSCQSKTRDNLRCTKPSMKDSRGNTREKVDTKDGNGWTSSSPRLRLSKNQSRLNTAKQNPRLRTLEAATLSSRQRNLAPRPHDHGMTFTWPSSYAHCPPPLPAVGSSVSPSEQSNRKK